MQLPSRESADTEPYIEFIDDEHRLDALKSRDKRLILISLFRYSALFGAAVIRYYLKR